MKPAGPADGEVEPERYDHSVPKPRNAGGAALASLLFLGGGQLVKGHLRRFLAIWGIFIALIAATIGGYVLAPPGSALGDWILRGGSVGLGLLWCYQLWDAVVRP